MNERTQKKIDYVVKIVQDEEVVSTKFAKKIISSDFYELRISTDKEAYAYYTGQIIEQARKESKMTQSELAEKVGSNKSYISRVETGRTDPKVSTFYRMASALGRSVELIPLP